MTHRSKTIYIFRHGQTDWNAEGRIQGHLDVPLNEVGRAQARRLIAPLRRLGIHAVLCSDLSRASESGRPISEALGIPFHLDERLREIYLGKVQGLTRDEILARFGEEFSDRLRHAPLSDADIACLGSESGEQVVARATAAIRSLFQTMPYDRIAVATHGGVIRRLVQLASSDQKFPAPIVNSVLYALEYRPPAGDEAERWTLLDQMPLR